MPRVGTNPNWNRFYLINKKLYSAFDSKSISQADFVAMCYDWIDEFSIIWEEHKFDNEYKEWLIYRGIGNSYSTSSGIMDAQLPHYLINNKENRKKAALGIKNNFEAYITEEQLKDINSLMLRFLSSKSDDGFISSYCRNVQIINYDKFKEYICSYLSPALERIEPPYEKLAAVLIYAQSGCTPVDEKEEEIEAYRAKIVELNNQINSLKNETENNSFGIYNSRDFHVLNDPIFFGNFYGFFRQSQNKSGLRAYKGLTPFKLKIENNPLKGVVASMLFSRYRPNGEEVKKEYIGTPMLGGKTIHLILQDTRGDDIITMMFNWIDINSGDLQFRQGFLMAQQRADRNPQLQKFVFFNQPIAEENEKYVDAFLRLNDNNLALSDSNVTSLSDESASFLMEYGKRTSGYTISISEALTAAQNNNLKDFDILRNLLEIEKQSSAPYVLSFTDENLFSDYFRSLLDSQEVFIQ